MKKKLRILVADDYEHNRNMLEVALRSFGYEVATAPNGEEAINAMRNERYDFVMTDFRMPKRNGLEVARFVKTHFPTTKVIMMSADYCEKTMIKAAGVDKFFEKPFSLKEIKKFIEEESEEEKEPFCGMEWDK